MKHTVQLSLSIILGFLTSECFSHWSHDIIFAAARSGNVDRLGDLQKFKDIPFVMDFVDNNGNTPLFLAVEFADESTVRYLIEELGADIEVQTKNTRKFIEGQNCFHVGAASDLRPYTVDYGGLKEIQYEIFNILNYLNSINSELKNVKDSFENNALHVATSIGNTKMVKFLIEELGMDVTETGYEGRNCFLSAVISGNLETVVYLNERHPNFMHDQNTYDEAIKIASRKKYADIEIFLKKVRSESENSRFLLAAQFGDIKALRKFYPIDDSILKSRDENGDTALILASRYADKQTVEYLVELGVDKTKVNRYGMNCFHAAVLGGKLDVLDYLYKFNDELRESGSTNYESGPYDDEPELSNYESGWASHSRTLENDTPLTLCCRFGDAKTLKHMIEELGFDIYDKHETGFRGNNCIHLATIAQDIHKLFYLRMSRQNYHLSIIRNENNHTALDIAMLDHCDNSGRYDQYGPYYGRYYGNRYDECYERQNVVRVLLAEEKMNCGNFDRSCRVPGIVVGSDWNHDVFVAAAKSGDIQRLRAIKNQLSKLFKVDINSNYFSFLVDSVDHEGNTALMLAATFADKDTVRFLIEEFGADPTKLNDDGRNCFGAAAAAKRLDLDDDNKWKQTEILSYLDSVNYDLKFNYRNDRFSCINDAAFTGNTHVVLYLLYDLRMKEEMEYSWSTKYHDLADLFYSAIEGGDMKTVDLLTMKIFPDFLLEYPYTDQNRCSEFESIARGDVKSYLRNLSNLFIYLLSNLPGSICNGYLFAAQ